VPSGCYFYVNGKSVGSFPSSINVIANMQRDPVHQDTGTRSIVYTVKDCEWVPSF
jgi:outer membrane protease